MMTATFLLALAALSALNILLLLTVFTDAIRLWPTPGQGSWQNYTFWPLFRGGLGLTIALGIWQFAQMPEHAPEAYIGAALAIVALGFTIYGYFDLGIENTYGADESLVTTGLYRYSRNPQYVASIAGFLGLAIAVGTVEIVLLSGLAIGVYALMPLAEEPWLARHFGESYDAYRQRTPRFLSISKLFNRLVTANEHR
ncbi:MAG: methyltransferase family protein [Rhodomicrobiaceae bacterium]